MSETLKTHLILASVGLMYGANYAIAKTVMPTYLAPSTFILIRVFLVTVLFWITHYFAIGKKKISASDFRYMALCAVFGVAVNQLLYFEGLSRTSPINASVIMTAVPIIVLIAAYFLLKEQITGWKIVGVVLGFSGALLLILDRPLSISNQTMWGDIMILGNATSYSIYLVLIKPLMKKYHPLTLMKWLFFMGFFMVLPFGVGGIGDIEWHTIPAGIWGSIAYVIIFPTYLAYLLNATAMRRVSPTLVGYYIYIQPVFSTIISILFFDEMLEFNKLTYALLIFLGVFVVNRSS